MLGELEFWQQQGVERRIEDIDTLRKKNEHLDM